MILFRYTKYNYNGFMSKIAQLCQQPTQNSPRFNPQEPLNTGSQLIASVKIDHSAPMVPPQITIHRLTLHILVHIIWSKSTPRI